MAHGTTLDMRAIQPVSPAFVHKHPEPYKVGDGPTAYYIKAGGMKPYLGASRDRSLPGKARRRARKALKAAGRGVR